jgi:hypothetical protein
MTSSPRLKKSASLLWGSLLVAAALFANTSLKAQQLAAYQDNEGRFFVFDNGRTMQAEYLPVRDFSIGGKCLLYTDNTGHLKMYYQGKFTTLEVNAPDKIEALDYLAVYSIGSIVKIIENGRVFTVSTNSVTYQAQDSLVTFYDDSQSLLAAYYKRHVYMLEDGLAGRPYNRFKTADNLVAYISSRTGDLKVFYLGQNQIIESFTSGGTFKAGRDVVAYVNQVEQKFKIFYKGEVFPVEDFPPQSYQPGDDLVAYVDNMGTFRVFTDGQSQEISSIKPDFYKVCDGMIVYGESGYFKVWYQGESYTMETYVPKDWQAQWNTVVYRDMSKNVKVFSKGESKVLTYDLAEDVKLYRDLIVVNKGLNRHEVFYDGKEY